MNKAASVKLSLRKLFIATLAIGPLAILPSPLWAIPTTSQYAATNGSVSLASNGITGPGGVATFTVSNGSVLVWSGNNFNVQAGEQWSFNGLTSTGAVLNKIGYNNDGTLALTTANATISGVLGGSGKVFILANGNIIVDGGATINPTGGVVLSTLKETSDFSFTTQGNLSFTGASTGTVNLGNGSTTAINVSQGSLAAYAGTVSINNITITSGDLLVNQTATTTAFTLGTQISVVSGNATIKNNGGTVSGGIWKVANGTTSVATDNTITLSSTSNDFKTVQVTNNGAAAAGDVVINDANDVILGASTVGRDLTVTVVGSGTATAISTSGTLAIGRSGLFSATSTGGNTAISIGNSSTIGSAGTFNATTGGDSSITFSGAGNVTTGTITTPGVGSTNGNLSKVSVTTNGVLTIGSAISSTGNGTSGGGITLSGSSIVQTGSLAASTGAASLTATAGNITTGTIGSTTVTLNASAGSINVGGQTGLITTTASGVTVKTASSGSADLSAANPLFAATVLQFTGGAITANSTGAVTLGTTSATGNVAINAGGQILLGTGSGTAAQNINITGVLTANATAGGIGDGNYTAFNVVGGLNLTAGGGAAITLDAANINGASLSPLVQFGAVSANTTGAVSIAETSTLNLGTIIASTLTANSVSGGIVQSDKITTTTSTTAIASPTGSIVLGNTSNSFGTLTVQGGTDASVTSGQNVILALASSAPANVTLTTTVGKNATLSTVNAGNLTVNSGNVIDFTGAVQASNLTLNSTGSGVDITQTAGTATVTGNTLVTSSGNITLNKANDFTGAVTINTVGDATVLDVNNLTVSGASGGLLTATAGSGAAIASTWNLVLGNLSVNSLTATASSSGGGNSGGISQLAGSMLHSENTAAFTTSNGTITLANAGNSAGRVQLTSGSGAIKYTEDGTVKLGNVSSTGTVTINATTGSIIDDLSANTRITANGTSGLTLNAPAGSISIGSGTHTAGATDGNVTTFTLNAPGGAVAVSSNAANVTVGATSANSLSVNATAGNIVQGSSAINVFGTANFIAGNTAATPAATGGNITLTNNSNNFGPILLTSNGTTNATVSINESGTMNLRTVSMLSGASGAFTATSANGDIITSGFGNVRPGGVVGGAGSGVVTLSALKGNITVGDATTEFPTTAGVVFNGNNVAISVLGNAPLVLGNNSTASTAGNLTVTSAIGNIANNGNLVVTGNASFTTGNANIQLNQAGNQFGAIKFAGNQVNIIQTNDMKILTGSSATGASSLASGGNITITNVGGSASFGNTLSLIATGNITLPKLIQVANTLSVNAAGTKDLSALSVSGDLSGKAPVNLGTGAYVAPQN